MSKPPGEHKNVEVMGRLLDDAEFGSLVASVDCYVSLHRSEGFGLNILEHMVAGTPVIATAYSGNMDFMSLLPPDYLATVSVAYEEVEIFETVGGVYPAGHTWAEPSTKDAARAMRAVAGNLGSVRRQAAAAAGILRREFSAKTRGEVQAARLAAIEPLGPVPDESLVCYWLKNPEIRASFRDMARVVAHWVLPEEYRRNRGCEFVSPTAYRAALDYLTGRAAT